MAFFLQFLVYSVLVTAVVFWVTYAKSEGKTCRHCRQVIDTNNAGICQHCGRYIG